MNAQTNCQLNTLSIDKSKHSDENAQSKPISMIFDLYKNDLLNNLLCLNITLYFFDSKDNEREITTITITITTLIMIQD